MRAVAAALVAGLVPVATGPAQATGGIECAAADGAVSLSLTIGSLPVLKVVGATIEADGETWMLGGEGDNALSAGQAFREDGAMRVDFTDPNVERVVAELRLVSASEGRDTATAGTLRIAGTGAWALACTGP